MANFGARKIARAKPKHLRLRASCELRKAQVAQSASPRKGDARGLVCGLVIVPAFRGRIDPGVSAERHLFRRLSEPGLFRRVDRGPPGHRVEAALRADHPEVAVVNREDDGLPVCSSTLNVS